MTKNPYIERVIEYNKRRAAEGEKASDMDVMIAALGKLPPGQLKKVLSEDVCAVLRKYGVEVGEG